MKSLLLALAFLVAAIAHVPAQGAVPDLKGTWTGKGKAVVLGKNAYHPGSQTASDPPRVRDIEATHVVEGQDGRLAWGKSSTSEADAKEPFVWAISSDNVTIVGADMDGYFRITLMSRTRMEKCYVHNGTSPSGSVVAACYVMNKQKK
jgi:hypothetical protein